MQELLEAAAGRIAVEDVKRLLADHAGGAAEWETTATLIAEPAARALHLSYGPPCEGDTRPIGSRNGNSPDGPRVPLPVRHRDPTPRRRLSP